MITKRVLGLLLIALGSLAIVGNLLLAYFEAGQYPGLGTAQLWALFISALVVALGLSLLPFGNRPA